MKTVDGFRLRELSGDYILIPASGGLVNFNKLISFNSTAAFLWKEVEGRENFSVEDLADLLVGQYDVDRETALKDSQSISQMWVENGIVVL